MTSNRFMQLQQQFVLVLGRVAGERQRIGGMVGAEDDRLSNRGPRFLSLFHAHPNHASENRD
jgi:hypothetical protein